MKLKLILSLLIVIGTVDVIYGDKISDLKKEVKKTEQKAANYPFHDSPFKIPVKYEKLMGDYRKGWARLSSFEYSGLHWGQFVVIYMNKDVNVYKDNYLEYVRAYVNDEDDDDEDEEDEKVQTGFTQYSVGTIFLKEHYSVQDNLPGTPLNMAYMIKREKGYDPEYGDWEYGYWGINGDVIFEGKASKNPAMKKFCVDCHKNMEERDYIFSTFLSNQIAVE